MNQRWRFTHGLNPNTGKITLGVYFLDGNAAQRDAVQALAPEWTDGDLATKLNFRFDVSRDISNIRISFSPDGGNNSRVGRQNKNVPKSQNNMNIQNTTRRVIIHEFGHALGLHHEHMNPYIGILTSDAHAQSPFWSDTNSVVYIQFNVTATDLDRTRGSGF